MRKVYISFLGTNDYVECMYVNGDPIHDSKVVRFVQESTLERLCGNWSEDDCGFIFVTELAKQRNWVDNGHINRKNGQPILCNGLKQCIDKLELPFEVMAVMIPEGHSEEEIWKIFDIVYGALEAGDEVIFDITHAFRSIPMLALVVLGYARVLKSIRLLSIQYGAFEVLGEAWKVKQEMPIEARKAPLLDLTSFAMLAEWTTAMDRFVSSGDAGAVKSLATEVVNPLLKAAKGKDLAAQAIKGLANALELFSLSVSTCRGPYIPDAAQDLKKELDKNREVAMIKPLVPLLDHVERQISLFSGDIVTDGFKAVRWCMDHGLIQQGFTILHETLISYFVSRAGKSVIQKKQCRADKDSVDRVQREILSSLVSVIQQKTPRDKWRGLLSEKEFQSDIATYELMLIQSGLLNIMDNLAKCRNDINHAAYNNDSLTAQQLSDKLNGFIEGVTHRLDFEI